MKAFFLAFAMNVTPVAPIDVLRFLRVPAIVWVLRRRAATPCRSASCRTRRRARN